MENIYIIIFSSSFSHNFFSDADYYKSCYAVVRSSGIEQAFEEAMAAHIWYESLPGTTYNVLGQRQGGYSNGVVKNEGENGRKGEWEIKIPEK